MKMRSAWSVLFLPIGLLGTSACGGPEVVQIGAIVSLEGAAASFGKSISNGIQVAEAEINAAGGIDVAQGGTRIPVEVIIRDAKSDPQIGLQAAQELIDLGLPAVIGSDSSDVTLTIADLFQDSGVILLSPSTSSLALSDKGSYIYRNFPSDELEAVNTANHIYNVSGIHEVDIIGSQSAFGLGIQRAFIERFRMLGGRTENTETFPAGATDLSDQAANLGGTQAGAIYIAGYSPETAAAAIAVRAAGIDLPLFGTGAILPDELVAAGGDAVEGLVYPSPTFDPDGEAEVLRRFVQGYRDMFGEGFDVYSAHAYDALMILAEAIQQEGLRPENISFYLNAMNAFPGAAGETTFDNDGNARKFHRMFVIRDGQAVPVGG